MAETHPQLQDDEPPEVELVIEAALRLREIVRQHRDNVDKRHAVDALGRALLRLKQALQ
jgi:hypothetical protein